MMTATMTRKRQSNGRGLCSGKAAAEGVEGEGMQVELPMHSLRMVGSTCKIDCAGGEEGELGEGEAAAVGAAVPAVVGGLEGRLIH